MAKRKKKTQPEPRFKVEMSLAQADILIKALDLFSRIGIGQIEEVANVLRMEPHLREGLDHQAVANALNFVKREMMNLDGNSSYGIANKNVPERYKIAWDLQQAIRHVVAWTMNPEGGFGVSFQEPLKTSLEPLATVEAVKEENPRSIDAPWSS